MAGSEPIDRLEIEIEATSTTAETRLNNITKALDGVRDSAARVISPFKAIREALNIGKQQSGMQAISKAMEQTKGQADSLQKTLSLASSGLDATKFSKELGKIDTEISKTDQKIQSLKDTLSYLKMPVSGASATGILGVADEVAEAEAKLKELEKVRSMLTDQRAALWSSMEQQGGAGATQQAQQATDALTKGLKNADVQALKTSRSLSEMQDRLAALERVKGFIKTSEYQTAAGQIRDYANAVDAATERVNALKSALADAQAGKLGMSTEGVSQLIKDYQGARSEAQYLGTAASYALKDAERAVKDTTGEVSRLSAAFQSVRSSAISGLKGIGSYIATNFTRPFKSAISTFDKWKSAIGRLALYRVIRTAIKAITDGLKEGTQNLYYFSQLAGSQFAATMDSLASSSLYLKNSIGAMAAPLIQAVAPAINFVIDKFVSLLNVINAVFAALGGKTTFAKAVKNGAKFGDDLAGSLGGAADSAKEIKRYLIGIDELNVIPDMNTGGGGGGGGGGLSTDYGSMFETVEIPSTITDLAKRIKDAIAAGDWYGVGAIFADKLNSVVANLDTKGWGLKLGDKITHGLQAAYGFLSNFSFSGLASKIAEFVNGAFENLDFSTAGRVFVRNLTIIPDMLIGFFSTLDFGLVARSLSNFLTGAFDEATTWLGSYDWGTLGVTAWQKIKAAVTNIDYAGIASTLFTFLGTAIRSAAKFLGGFFGNITSDIKRWWDTSIKGTSWKETASNLLSAIGRGFVNIGGWVMDNIVDPFCNALLGEDTWADLKESGKNLIEGLWSGITSTLADVGGWLKEHLVDPVVNGVKSLFGIASPSTVFAEIGGYLVEGLYNGISSAWDMITGFFSDTLGNLGGLVSDGWEAIKGGTETAWDTVSGWLGDAWESIKGTASKTWENISSVVESAWDNITGDTSTKTGAVKSDVSSAFNSVKSSISTTLQSAKSTASSSWDNIKTTVSRANSSVSSAVSSAWDRISSSLSGSLGGVQSSVSSTFSSIVSSAWSWGSDLAANIANGISYGVQWVKNAASNVAGWIRSYLHFSVPDIGPLKDFDTYMPDMMKQMAAGISGNRGLVLTAVSDLTSDMAKRFGFTAEPEVVGRDLSGELSYSVKRADIASQRSESMRRDDIAEVMQTNNEDLISVIFGAAQQIITAINEKDTAAYMDGRKVSNETTASQNRLNIMFGKSLQNA